MALAHAEQAQKVIMAYELDHPEEEKKVKISLNHSEEEQNVIVAYELEFDCSEDEKTVIDSENKFTIAEEQVTRAEEMVTIAEEKVITAEEKVITGEEKVITAEMLPEDDSYTAILPVKRTLGDSSSDTAVSSSSPSSSPTKRQKKDVIGELEVKDFVTQDGNFDTTNEVIAVVDEDVGGSAIESEPITEEGSPSGRPNVDGDEGGGAIESETTSEEETLTEKEGATDNAGATILTLGEQRRDECRRKRKSDAPLLNFGSVVVFGPRFVLGRDECRWKKKSGLMPLSSSDDDDESGTSPTGSPANEPLIEPLKGCSSRLNLPNALRRQQEDRGLRIKVHRVENDYYNNKISREVYNEQRFNLYTEEEMTEKSIVWPRREVYSPAGFREDELEHAVSDYFSKQTIDDLLFEFGCPFDRNGGSDEEAAKKRWMDEIEGKLQDPEARAAECRRWEKIREVETKYHHKRIDRDEYNELRYALYTEEEREARGVVWPNEECQSPAGYREEVLEGFIRSEVDWETRMEFHLPIPPDDPDEEENLCELCIPAVKIAKLKKEERERRAAAESKAWEEERARRLEAESRYPCAHCKRKFASDIARRQHKAAMHKDLVVVQEKKEEQETEEAAAERRIEEEALGEEELKKRRKQEEAERRRIARGEAKPYHCNECNRKFATDIARSQHKLVKHRK